MVWGLDKLFGSNTPSEQPAPAAVASPVPVVSERIAPTAVASTSIPPEASRSQVPATQTFISPSLIHQQRPASTDPDAGFFSPRSRKQFTLFAAGAAFLLLSSRITTRSLRKRALGSVTPFYRPSNVRSTAPVNGPLEAVEALSIATVNVVSSTIMVAGGLLWAFDISSITDLRRKIRGGLGVDGTGRSEAHVEEEFEEWLATVLERKKAKEEQVKANGQIVADQAVLREWKNERGQPR